jgi:hypothetical protein
MIKGKTNKKYADNYANCTVKEQEPHQNTGISLQVGEFLPTSVVDPD